MEKIKCITFDKKAQDSLPEHIKAKMKADRKKTEIEERLKKRMQRMQEAKTPTELAYTIWTQQLEDAMGSSRDCYRKPFIEWIEAYKNKITPKQWTKYKTPEELAEDLWNPRIVETDESDVLWFGSLRTGLVEWIKTYAGRS